MPAVAVRHGGQTLSIKIGRKGYVGFFYIYIKYNIILKIEFIAGMIVFLV